MWIVEVKVLPNFKILKNRIDISIDIIEESKYVKCDNRWIVFLVFTFNEFKDNIVKEIANNIRGISECDVEITGNRILHIDARFNDIYYDSSDIIRVITKKYNDINILYEHKVLNKITTNERPKHLEDDIMVIFSKQPIVKSYYEYIEYGFEILAIPLSIRDKLSDYEKIELLNCMTKISDVSKLEKLYIIRENIRNFQTT